MLHFALCSLFFIYFPTVVWSHARLMLPPSRSSMWRLGFPTKKNFNDNALYCGGIQVQWKRNGGKCGICGDPYDMPHPRDNEAGGKYGRGIISKRYTSGQTIEAKVQVTTNHKGYFVFKLCPNNNPKREATQECLDKHVLKEAHGTGTKYYIGNRGQGDITLHLQLPKGLTCSQCVFQWTYVAGNNWGRCADGTSGLGCGIQETFRGCADIAIEDIPNTFDENDIRNKLFGVPYYKMKNTGFSTDSKYTDIFNESKSAKNNESWYNSLDDKHPLLNEKQRDDKQEEFSTQTVKASVTSDPEQLSKGNTSFRDSKENSPATETRAFGTVNFQQKTEDSLTPKTIINDSSDANRSLGSKKIYTYHSTDSLPHFLFSARNLSDIWEKKDLSRGFGLNGRNYKDIFFL